MQDDPKLYHNSLYKKLYSVFDAPPEKRPKIITGFLDNWEKFLLKEDIPMMNSDDHDRPGCGWTGYWCYPAAALVAALNIDDSTFIDHEFYPTDLMFACAPYRGEPVILPPIVDAPEPLPPAPKRKPKRQPAPALLIPFTEVFDQLAATLPESLQNTLWNQMITWLKEEYEGDTLDAIDFIYALNGGEVGAELNSRFKRTLMLHVDWKDDESALHFTQQMARTVGIDALFEPDPLSLNAPERVWEVLFIFNEWLAPQGWCVLPLNLGDDAYHACLVSAQSEEEVRTLLESTGFSLHTFTAGKPF
ncbi:protein of unknown function [Neptunomonas antarctica]|uniref:Uncharacterized protein n=1 Tax=Neptunomonas antarctica TaxID=619304 RepID=A0A1N7IUJ3_9GAMM|nr:PoNe immunity protein domain-containing protein [Neptunomonas antarctica]SIS40734.1 protein of unknown function [Neptunomonas antarctica]